MSAWLAMLHFQRPLWLWGLVVLPLLIVVWRLRQRRHDVWRDAIDPHLLPHLIEPARGRPWLGAVAAVLAVALCLVALAGPGWRQEAQPQWQPQMPLVVAFDLSSSVTTPDLPPSRLLQARAKLAQLLREREGGEIGLVAWADDAFTVAPLTGDAANVALFVDALSPEVMPVDGGRPARAIAHAAALLRQAGFGSGEILLFAGTADAASREAAAQAVAQGYRVSVLGLGSAAGAFHRDRAGQLRRAALDEAALRAVAVAGGGRYATLVAGDADLQALAVLQPGAGERVQAQGEGARVWLDQGYWLLLPLLVLAAFGFRRGGRALPMLLGLMLLPPAIGPVQAEESSWWRRADQTAQRAVADGVDAYRQGDFAAAEQAFDGRAGADAHYNLGNALARQGKYDEAIAAYDRALAERAGMADAVANRAVVEAARKRRQSGGEGQPPPGQGKQDDAGQPGQPGQDGTPSPGEDTPAQDGQGDAAPQPPQQGGDEGQPQGRDAPPPTAEDAAAAQRQQEADAAQRERMRQALEAQGGAPTGEAAASGAASAEAREQQQARDAWLRRVPDEPGGLLRAKFQIEQERRRREGR